MPHPGTPEGVVDYRGKIPSEILAIWERGCSHIKPGMPPSSCEPCTRSAVQAIQLPSIWAALFFRRTYNACMYNPKHEPKRKDLLRASGILDWYQQNKVIHD